MHTLMQMLVSMCRKSERQFIRTEIAFTTTFATAANLKCYRVTMRRLQCVCDITIFTNTHSCAITHRFVAHGNLHVNWVHHCMNIRLRQCVSCAGVSVP